MCCNLMASIHTHKMIGLQVSVITSSNQNMTVSEKPGAALACQVGQTYIHVNRSFTKVHLVLLGS